MGPARRGSALAGPIRCRRKFLRLFPAGFRDETYIAWERGYKSEAHERWNAALDRGAFGALLDAGGHEEIAAHALRVESRTNLLFSFEKMALRDAVRSAAGARAFSAGLFDFLYGSAPPEERF